MSLPRHWKLTLWIAGAVVLWAHGLTPRQLWLADRKVREYNRRMVAGMWGPASVHAMERRG